MHSCDLFLVHLNEFESQAWVLQILVSHMRSRLAEFFVGSVSTYVVKNCTQTVVLLH